jgi:hypothetical protein
MADEYSEAVGVPLAYDTQVQIPVAGMMLSIRQVVGVAIAAGPIYLGLRFLPEPAGMALAVTCGMVALGMSSVTREGMWFGTWLLARRISPWLPHSIRGGVVSRARVKRRGNTLQIADVRPAKAVPKEIGGLSTLPRLRTVRDGLIETVPGGWYAVVEVQGPSSALNEMAYARWTESFMAWLAQIDTPAQVLAVRDYWDGDLAQQMFDERVVSHSELAREERALVGEVAGESLRLRHLVVFTPGRGTKKGMPDGGFLGPIGTQAPIRRSDAESVLELAMRVGIQRHLQCAPVEALQLRAHCERTLLAAQEGAAADGAIRLGDRHLATLAVTKLPPSMFPGTAIKALLRTNARSTASLHWFPLEGAEARNIIDQRRRMHRVTQQTRPGGDIEQSVAEEKLTTFLDSITRQEDSVCRIALTVTVEGPDPATAEAARDAMQTHLAEDDIKSVPVTVPGFWPVATTAPGGLALRRGLILTSQRVASCLVPVLGTPMSDLTAPYLGFNVQTGCPVYLDVFSLPNHSAVVFGTTGGGKSVTTKTMIARQVLRGVTAIVADPESEYRQIIEELGGRYYELGVDSSLNPLSAGLHEELVDDAAGIVLTALGVMVGETVGMKNGSPIRQLRDADQGWLHEVLCEFFTAWRASPHRNEEPTLTWLCRWIEAKSLKSPLIANSEAMQTHYREILLRLKRYTQGRYGPIFDRPSAFSIVQGQATGLGLKSLAMQAKAELTPAIVMLITSIYATIGKTNGRTIVMIDEAHHLTNGDADAARAVGMLVRKARKYRIGIWMASQMPKDFLETELGAELAENAQTKVVLGLERAAGDLAQAKFSLSDMEMSFICPEFERGRAVVIAGKERVIVQVDPGDYMMRFIRTGEASAA